MTPAMLYVTEWTAADGSKRRPIVERVPECRPLHCDDPCCRMRLLVREWDREHLWWTLPEAQAMDSGRDSSRFVSPTEAASLLRCAVEDWLMKQFAPGDGGAEISIQTRDGGWNGGNVIVSFRCQKDHFGESIHHALIATAHAVADMEGIAP